MGLLIFFLVSCVAIIMFAVYISRKQKEAKQQSEEAVNRIIKDTGFVVSKSVPVINGKEILIDDTNKKWMFKRYAADLNPPIYSYSDLLEFEITQNGGSIAKGVSKGKTNGKTSGKMGSAIVGGVLFGPVGAIVGSSGKRKSTSSTKTTTTTTVTETCTSLQVRITVNDLHTPQIVIPFITSEVPLNSSSYKTSIYLAKNLAATLAYIQSGKSAAELEHEATQNKPSPSDELKKFFDLKESGAITEEEFESKKKQLLGL